MIRRLMRPLFAAAIVWFGMAGGLVAVGVEAAGGSVQVSSHNCSPTGANHKPYCTVQEGVDAAGANGTVIIQPGTYVEQVKISSADHGLTIEGQGSRTVIKAPAVMTSPKAIVQVTGATGVTIQDLTVSGPGGSSCDSLEYGIRIDGGGEATIQDSRITKIEDNPFSGCQNGVAIQVGRSAESTTGSATIVDNVIDQYQKNGITVSGNGSHATIQDNRVIGAGPTAVNGQNGIQISSGATATLTDNTITKNIYTPQTVTATGILLFDAGTVQLTDNRSNQNDTGIYVTGVTNSTFTDNLTNQSSFNGIYVDTNATGNTFQSNSAHGTVSGPLNYDIEDDSTGSGTQGTANTWQSNSCKTSSPAGLCR